MLNKINTLIPSCDRACQLHLLLESLERNAPGVFNPSVVFRATNEEHQKSYLKLSERFPSLVLTEQASGIQNLFKEFWRLTETSDDFVAFFVDDNIMYRPMTHTDCVLESLTDPQVSSFSLRLGKNVTHDGPQDKAPLVQPIFLARDLSFIDFSLRAGYGTCHYCYPFSIDGHIYRKDLVMKYANRVDWSTKQTPNDIEGAIVGEVFKDIGNWPDLCVCYYDSIVLNNVMNRVSSNSNTLVGQHGLNVDSMARLYNKDKIIDFDAIDFTGIKQCHTDIEIGFKQWKR